MSLLTNTMYNGLDKPENLPPLPYKSTYVDQFYKTKICPFFLRNECSRGENCSFAHTEDEIRFPSDLSKTRLCKDWQRRQCNKADCPFAHSYSELRHTDDYYKTALCVFWSEEGKCPMGNYCRHAHGNHEIRDRGYRWTEKQKGKMQKKKISQLNKSTSKKSNSSTCNHQPSISTTPSYSSISTTSSNLPNFKFGKILNDNSFLNPTIQLNTNSHYDSYPIIHHEEPTIPFQTNSFNCLPSKPPEELNENLLARENFNSKNTKESNLIQKGSTNVTGFLDSTHHNFTELQRALSNNLINLNKDYHFTISNYINSIIDKPKDNTPIIDRSKLLNSNYNTNYFNIYQKSNPTPSSINESTLQSFISNIYEFNYQKQHNPNTENFKSFSELKTHSYRPNKNFFIDSLTPSNLKYPDELAELKNDLDNKTPFDLNQLNIIKAGNFDADEYQQMPLTNLSLLEKFDNDLEELRSVSSTSRTNLLSNSTTSSTTNIFDQADPSQTSPPNLPSPGMPDNIPTATFHNPNRIFSPSLDRDHFFTNPTYPSICNPAGFFSPNNKSNTEKGISNYISYNYNPIDVQNKQNYQFNNVHLKSDQDYNKNTSCFPLLNDLIHSTIKSPLSTSPMTSSHWKLDKDQVSLKHSNIYPSSKAKPIQLTLK